VPLIVETRTGKVRGRMDRGVTAFRGIAFARAPIRGLRFAAPRLCEPWAGVRDCSEAAAAAPQNASRFQALIGDPAPRQSEDCLNLDLWTAGFDGVPRPVLVFVHGGDFATGGAAAPHARGRRLARGGDLVVVSLQYRLGALGFLEPNLGLLDLIAGLEWVRDEIDAFGGDPTQVTLYGHGAGATAVACLLAMPLARKLFQRAIAASGRFEVDSRERASERRHAFMRELGLAVNDSEKLRDLPLQALLACQARADGFRPVVDGEQLPHAPLDAAAGGTSAAVPLLIGSCRDETSALELVDPTLRALRRDEISARLESLGVQPERARAALEANGSSEVAPNALFHRLATELCYRAPAQRLADALSARGAPVYQYRFELAGRAASGEVGAFHGLDLPLVFGTRRVSPLGAFFDDVPEAKPVGRKMRDAWTAFARRGDPRSPLLSVWPRYTESERNAVSFSERE
jgi:para-nitrobenzyl esterase